MHYLLKSDISEKILGVSIADNSDSPSLKHIGEFQKTIKPIEMKIYFGNTSVPDIMGLLTILIVSDKVKKLMNRFPYDFKHLEFYPVEIYISKERTACEYWLMNIVKNITGFVLNESFDTAYRNTDTKYESNLLSEETERNIFQVSQNINEIVVSEKLKDSLLNENIVGAEFILCEDLF